MAPSLPVAPSPHDDATYWRGLERTLIILRFVGVLLFSPVLLLQPGLEWPATLAFVLAYNSALLALLHRVDPTRLGLAAVALDLGAMTGLLAALGSGPPFTSLYIIGIAHAAGRFGTRGGLGSWAVAALLHLGLVALGQVPAPPLPEWAFQMALWLIVGVIVGEVSRRLRQSRETVLLAGELRASREQAEAALAQEQRQRQIAETLQQLALELNADLDEEHILNRTLELAIRMVPGHSVVVWLLEGDQARVAATSGRTSGPWMVGARRPAADHAFLSHMVATGRPLRIDHLQIHPSYSGRIPYQEPQSYLAAPLSMAGRTIGMVSIRERGIAAYTEEHERALAAFAAQAALALHNARLIARERRHRELAETLQQLALELNAELDEGRILSRTLELAQQVVPGESGIVWLVEGDEMRVAAVHGGGAMTTRVGDRQSLSRVALVRHLVESGQTLRLDHMQADPRYAGITQYDAPQSYIGAPLTAGGRALGTISVRQAGIGAYTAEHEQTLAAFAGQAALALHNARLMDAAERHAREEETLARAVAAIAAGASLPEACEALLRELRALLPFDRATVALVEPGDLVRLVGVYGTDQTSFPAGSLIPLSASPNAAVLASRRTRVIADLAQDASLHGRELSAEGYRSAVMAPLITFVPGPAHGGSRRVAIGSLNILSRAPARYGPSDVALLDRVAARLAGAFSAARLREERDRGAARIALLQRLTAVTNRTVELRRVFDEFARELRRAVPFDRLTLFLLQGEGETALRYAVWGRPGPRAVEGTTLPVAGSGVLAEVLATGQPALRADIAAEARYPIDRELVDRGLRSDALLPLVAGGRNLGALALGSSSPGAFSVAHLELLGPVAEQLALAVDRSLAYERVVEQATRLEAVNRVARLVAEGPDLRRTFAAFVAALQPLVPHDRAILSILRPGAEELERLVEAVAGDEEMADGSPSIIPLEGSVAGAVLQRRQPLLRRDIGGADPASGLVAGIRSSVLLPLVVGDQALGVLILGSRQPGAFQESHLLLLEPLADQLALALQNALLHEATHNQALTDPLTGLPNRRHFDQRLEPELQRARRLGYPLGFLFVDMDEFKEINDTLGHQAGDAALRQASAALTVSLRASDFLARWGGDEFVVLLPGVTSEELPVVGEKLQRSLAGLSPYVPGAAGRPLSVSMGGAIFPRDGNTAEGLVEVADGALRAAKARGGGCLVLATEITPPTP